MLYRPKMDGLRGPLREIEKAILESETTAGAGMRKYLHSTPSIESS